MKNLRFKNNTHNTYPFFAHCPGSAKLSQENWLLLKNLFEGDHEFTHANEPMPTNISVITWNTSWDKSILEKSCECFGVKYYSLCNGAASWNNIMKISSAIEFAAKCETKYILGIDGFDAVAVRAIDQSLGEILARKRVKMMFNSTPAIFESYPYLSSIEPSIYDTKYKLNSLNAGAWFGETEFVRKFFDHCLKVKDSDHLVYNKVISTKMKHDPRTSEQALIKVSGYDFLEDIGLDDKCEIFSLLRNREPNDDIACDIDF